MGYEFPKTVVVGAGGMGALFGGIICEGGLDVVLRHVEMGDCAEAPVQRVDPQRALPQRRAEALRVVDLEPVVQRVRGVAADLDRVHELLGPGGRLILDVRKETDGRAKVEAKFDEVSVAVTAEKYERLVAIKQ